MNFAKLYANRSQPSIYHDLQPTPHP